MSPQLHTSTAETIFWKFKKDHLSFLKRSHTNRANLIAEFQKCVKQIETIAKETWGTDTKVETHEAPWVEGYKAIKPNKLKEEISPSSIVEPFLQVTIKQENLPANTPQKVFITLDMNNRTMRMDIENIANNNNEAKCSQQIIRERADQTIKMA